MQLYLIILTLFFSQGFSCTKNENAVISEKPFVRNQQVSKDSSANVCFEFNELNTKVRDGLISKKDAIEEIKTLVPQVRKYFFDNGGKEYSYEKWIFPVKGLGPSAIGGTNGSGYNAKGYDYFDGNRHGGHPAHDIFINDKNQDDIDDYSGEPVDILSMSSGVVVALEKEWDTKSGLRGGKYIWIYDTHTDALFYYAHNRKVTVNVGDIVKPGDKIAEMGRSGLNAYKKRSPTHLHFSFLPVKDGVVKPEDPYEDLINAKVIR
ncbi:MAG: M23 family metallopeptidase [Ignavibacteriae bacterium]|nr:M23 family metallopeptidase [Ignavibacteriota bacterium]